MRIERYYGLESLHHGSSVESLFCTLTLLGYKRSVVRAEDKPTHKVSELNDHIAKFGACKSRVWREKARVLMRTFTVIAQRDPSSPGHFTIVPR